MIVWIINAQTFGLSGLVQPIIGRNKCKRTDSAFEQSVFNCQANGKLSRIISAQSVFFG